MPKRSKTSAGLLMFGRNGHEVEVLLAHPGGPFFRRRDEGVWTIPKGEAAEGEALLSRAKIEFEEEVGIAPAGEWMDIGSIKQKDGKIVHGWAFEGDLPEDFIHRCNTFEMMWPPGSGKLEQFPEIDCVAFFPLEVARIKLKPAQIPFLDRLSGMLTPSY